jgi:hypothetical protein
VHELSTQSSGTGPSATAAGGNTSWTSSLAGLGLFAGGSSQPEPASPSPTFGSVVTSPRQRRVVSLEGSGLAALQQVLRIPMPELHHGHHTTPSPRSRTRSGMYMLGLGMGRAGGQMSPRLGGTRLESDIELD